jgi:hypothetical protein
MAVRLGWAEGYEMQATLRACVDVCVCVCVSQMS